MNHLTADQAATVFAFRAQLAALPAGRPQVQPEPRAFLADRAWDFVVEVAADGSARSVFGDGSSAPYVPLEAAAAVAATRELLAAA